MTPQEFEENKTIYDPYVHFIPPYLRQYLTLYHSALPILE
jgi:hypothetical protein